MRLVYLNADPGIALHAHKGASVHVRQMLRALAPRVDSLTVVTARVGRPGAPGKNGGGGELPCRIVAPELRKAPGARGDGLPELAALGANDALERELDRLAAAGDMDAIYERYSLWSVAGCRAARRWGVPWVLEVNAPLVEEAARHRGLELSSAASFLESELFRSASGLVTVSSTLRDYAVGRGVAPERVRTVPNGYDERLFHRLPEARGHAEDTFTIAFAGSLKPWHGVDVLVEAFLRLHREEPTTRLLIVGDGPQAESLRARLEAEASPQAFHFTGAVPHEEVAGRLRGADVAVAPYPALDHFYFSPLKVVEYAAMGFPIVASRIGQITEILEDGRSALLTRPGDAEDLARALRVLRNDEDLRRRIGEGAFRAARDRTWDRAAEQVVVGMRALVRESAGMREVGA